MQVGVDIVEVSRVRSILERWGERFLNHIYTANEQKEKKILNNPIPYLAGRWAAKEALMKAIGRSCSWKDFEITKGDKGQPVVTLLNKAYELVCGKNENISISVSISHAKEHAVAMAVLYKSLGT